MATKKTVPINFEKSLSQLEKLVEQMEQGELSLEDTLKRFEQGIALTRSCQTALAAAEQRVEQLLQTGAEDGAVAPYPDPNASTGHDSALEEE